MNFEQLIFGELSSGDVELTNLDEGFLPLNSTLAYFTLKRNALGKLKNIGGKSSGIKKGANDIKAKGLMAKEKLRASAGLSGGKGEHATSYKLTKEQLEVLSKIKEKYGKTILDEVMLFRKNILAPYQVIKRLVRNNKTIASKDKFGMTHAQYKAAVDSGLKKIEKRGDTFFEKNETGQKALDDLGKSIDALMELRKDFIATGKLRESIVNRVLRDYDLGTADFEESLDDLRKTYDEMKKNEKLISGMVDKSDKNKFDPYAAQDLVKRNIELRKGIVKQERENKETSKMEESLLKEDADFTNSEEFKKNNKFNAALGKYMLRRNVVDELKVENNNKFKQTYVSIINKMIEQAVSRRKEILGSKTKQRMGIEFNDIERKIYKIKPGIKLQYSNKPGDYALAIKDEDFTDTEYVKRPPELVKAEQAIEAEIKKFERFLQKELDPSDYKELKKFRLINNLISVGELSEPNKLFKSPEELRAMKKKESPEAETPPEEEEKDPNYDVSIDEI